jgi:biopolymer transport protein ExbB/TolQ
LLALRARIDGHVLLSAKGVIGILREGLALWAVRWAIAYLFRLASARESRHTFASTRPAESLQSAAFERRCSLVGLISMARTAVMTRSSSRPASPKLPRSRAAQAAFVIGLPLAASVLWLFHFGPLQGTQGQRYVSHGIECVEVVMFCVAISALLTKLWISIAESRACGREILPGWDGQTVPVSQAEGFKAKLNDLPRPLRNTLIVRRTAAVLDFLASRGSANELDDQLRALADNDAIALEGSYGLTRFITWAIPILGFLGTVLGITTAIQGVSPEVLEKSLSTVTDGLALAFDATALALGLTMLTMFTSFLVERREQSILEAVDRYADSELAHRFERVGGEGGAVVEVTRQSATVLVQAVEQLVQRQTALWAKALEETDRRRGEAEKKQQDRFTGALEKAIEQSLDAHARRLTQLEKQFADQNAGFVQQLSSLAGVVREASREQQAGLAQVAQALAGQIEALARLQEGEKQMARLQETLSQNLATLASAGSFEEALHSLTAAIHLLTARAGQPAAVAGRVGSRPGAAA